MCGSIHCRSPHSHNSIHSCFTLDHVPFTHTSRTLLSCLLLLSKGTFGNLTPPPSAGFNARSASQCVLQLRSVHGLRRPWRGQATAARFQGSQCLAAQRLRGPGWRPDPAARFQGSLCVSQLRSGPGPRPDPTARFRGSQRNSQLRSFQKLGGPGWRPDLAARLATPQRPQ
jgi:hypothetical protein